MKNEFTYKQPLSLSDIIRLVQNYYPDRIDIISGLQNASGGSWNGKAYFGFVDSTNANQVGSEW
jgi:hypothetical protein